MAKKYTFRLTSEGVKELQAEMAALGAGGEAAFKKLTQSAPQLANALLAAETSVKRANVQLTEMARTAPTVAANSNRAGFALQNAAFQVGDFAVQVASGQSAMRAFVQQGSQLLGFFGPWGAVFGAALAVVGGLVTQLDLFSGSASDAERAIERLNVKQESGSAAADLYKAAIERANDVLQTHKEKVDAAAESQARLAKETVRAAIEAEQQTLRDLQEQVRERQRIVDEYNRNLQQGVGVEFGLPGPGQASPLEVEVSDLNAAILATVGNIRRLQEEFAKLNDPSLSGAAREAAEEAAEQAQREAERLDKEARRREESFGDWLLNLRERLQKRITAEEEREEAERQRLRERAAEEQARLAEKQAEEMARPFTKAIENIQDAFGDLFTYIFDDDPIDAAENLANSLRNIFARLAGEIASAMVIRPVLSGIGLQGFAPAGGAAGGTSFSLAGGTGLNFTGMQNLFAGNAAPPPDVDLSGNVLEGPGTPIVGTGAGYPFLAAGLGAAAYGLPLLTGLIGGNLTPDSIGSSVGGIIGSVAGGFLGPVGSIFGGLIGSTLGGLVGGLFGSENNYPKAAAYLKTQGGALVGAGYQTANDAGQEYIEAATTLRDTAAAQINALAAALGATFGEGGLGYFGPGGIGGIQAKAGNFNTVVGTKAEKFGKDQRAALENYIVEVLSQSISRGLLTGISESVRKAVSTGGDYDKIADLLKDINLGRLADGLGLLSENAISFQAELIKLQEEFAAARKRADELGFAIDDQLTEQLENAKDALEEKYFGQFRAFEQALIQGPLSTLSPEAKFFEARTAYTDIERRALAGDALAQSQFIGAAQTYLSLAREQFASTGSYATIYEQVLAATRQLGSAPSIDMAPVVSAVASSGQAIVTELQAVRKELQDLRRETALDRNRRAVAGK